jgi:hypothetical protein
MRALSESQLDALALLRCGPAYACDGYRRRTFESLVSRGLAARHGDRYYAQGRSIED